MGSSIKASARTCTYTPTPISRLWLSRAVSFDAKTPRRRLESKIFQDPRGSGRVGALRPSSQLEQLARPEGEGKKIQQKQQQTKQQKKISNPRYAREANGNLIYHPTDPPMTIGRRTNLPFIANNNNRPQRIPYRRHHQPQISIIVRLPSAPRYPALNLPLAARATWRGLARRQEQRQRRATESFAYPPWVRRMTADHRRELVAASRHHRRRPAQEILAQLLAAPSGTGSHRPGPWRQPMQQRVPDHHPRARRILFPERERASRRDGAGPHRQNPPRRARA